MNICNICTVSCIVVYIYIADIWSVGATVLEMLTGRPPWHHCPSHVAAMLHIATTNELPEIPEEISMEAKHFIIQCLNR